MSKSKQQTTTLIIVGIPIGIKFHFKAHCAKRGKTMKSEIIEFMESKARKDKR